MPDKADVVNLERFSKGLTYQEYVNQIKSNKDQFDKNYGEFKLKEEDKQSFQELVQRRGPIRVLVLGEDWCPDVYRGVPVMARIAEEAGLDMRVFPRDQNHDIMNFYLNHGQFMSIPTIVFFDKDFTELGHWIERAKAATEFMTKVRDELTKSGKSEEEIRAESRRRNQEMWDTWRQEQVRELKELLKA